MLHPGTLRSLSKRHGQACSGSVGGRGYIWDELHRVHREPRGRGLLCAHPITGEPGEQRENNNDAEPRQRPAARRSNRPQQEVRSYSRVYVKTRLPKTACSVLFLKRASLFTPSGTISSWPSPARLSLGSASQASSCPTEGITGVTSQHGQSSSRGKRGPKPPVPSPTKSGSTSRKMVGLNGASDSLPSLSPAGEHPLSETWWWLAWNADQEGFWSSLTDRAGSRKIFMGWQKWGRNFLRAVTTNPVLFTWMLGG